MNRFVFHWLDGSEIKVFANSFSEAVYEAGLDEEELKTLDYCKDETEIPDSEKILLLESEGQKYKITNELMIALIRNSELSIGRVYGCFGVGIQLNNITCTKIDGCSATFSPRLTVPMTNKDAELLAI